MEFSKEQTNQATPYVSVNTLIQPKNSGLSVYPPYAGVASKKPEPESVVKSNPVVQQKQSEVELSQGQADSEKAEPGVFDRVLAVGLGGAAEIVAKTPTGCFVPVPGFEFMQNFFKGMMVGALERLSQEKVAHLWRIFQNIARAVNSVEYMKAYFWGFLRGFFGDFILLWELPGIVKNTAAFLGNLITQIKELSKEDYEAFAGRIDEIKALVVTSGREYIDSIMRDVQAGKASRLIIEILQTAADFSQETGKTVGGYVTGTMLEYFSKEYKELGKELGGVMGEASGTITFTVLLAAITAGGGAVWGAVRAGIKTVTEIIGKGVGLATKAIATTLKNISRVFGVLIDGARVVIKGFGKGAAKLFKGLKGKLDEVLVKVKQLVDDLLERLSRKRATSSPDLPSGKEPPKQSPAKTQVIKEKQVTGTGGVDAVAEALGRKTIRILDQVSDSAIANRVKSIRSMLTSDFKKSGNFGLAQVEISGLKKEFYAHSGIDVISDARSAAKLVSDISVKPTSPIFKATSELTIDGRQLLRDIDTEYKILNDIAAQLGDNVDITGRIILFTERAPCASCDNVILVFLQKYKNMKIDVIHNNSKILIP